MTTKDLYLELSPEIGRVSAVYTLPAKPICLAVLAHGAGADMNHAFMVELSNALAELKIGSLRFNFSFMENKKKRPDFPAVAHKAIESALREARKSYPKIPVVLSGKSFGGRMSSQYLALDPQKEVQGIVFFGFPLHAIKKPSTDRADHLKKVKVPMLFLQGTKDQLAEWNLIEEVCTSLPNATLVKIDGADHAFKKGKENLIPELASQTKQWLEKII